MAMQGNPTVHIPEPGEGKRGEEGHLGYLLRQAAGTVRLAMERALEDLGVTPPQFLVMTMINAYPGSSGADVARLTMLTPQTISVIVANLERDGRIMRVPGAGHGRVLPMALTAEGLALLAQCRERTQAVEARMATNLSPDEERAVRRWLVDMATRDLTDEAATEPPML
jgi:DNA-binding MarR family transcriptional regulator